ncbi:MAG TPA: methyltransferase domain-containing protein [Thermoanaerobaculia bacterium]|nr:methyltransferase domain-containing protein [Thermoanaerobaculia bacterium]
MAIAVLYPRYDHPAIEERYASWQTQMLLRAADEVEGLYFYDVGQSASSAADDIDDDHVLVITDPLLLPSSRLAVRLREALASTNASAVVPVANTTQQPKQFRPPFAPYLTLREFQETTGQLEAQPASIETIQWDGSDPAAYLCPITLLDDSDKPLHAVLEGRDVAISATDYVHRWSSLRGQIRHDLLNIVGTDARSVLEFGCGEAPLGEALKQRQPCRVVGIELDPHAAAIAQKRIDAVYRGDVREIVSILNEKFDWIIGGDIVEHLDEPWSFLSELRHLAKPGGHLLLSLPNLSNASIVGDLLHGRFDYVYMGLTCVGHLRFFTKRTIEEMLTIAGWSVERITPQDSAVTPAREDLLTRLRTAGIPFSEEDLAPSGYYVIAVNRVA